MRGAGRLVLLTSARQLARPVAELVGRAGTPLRMASETGCEEPSSTREAVAIETPARRLLSAGEGRRARYRPAA